MIEKAFTDESTHPLVLYLICERHLEKDWNTWISDTIVQEIKRIFNVDIVEINLNKLLAVKTLYINDVFWDEWEIFKNGILSLNGQPLSTQILVAPNIAFLMNGIEIANLIRTQPFDQEIGRFVAGCLLHENIFYAPPPLDFCQIYISQPMYHCPTCDCTRSALPPFDGQCETCAGTYDSPKAFNFKPKNDTGFSVTYSLTYDLIPIKKRYEQLLKEKEPYINEVPEDIQASKLLIARDYTMLKMNEFHSQLKLYGVK
jgi:hypothetical protein